MKNEIKIRNLSNPTLFQDPRTKYYADNKTLELVPNSEFDNTTIVRTNKNNNFISNVILGCESVYVNTDPQYDLELATTQYTETSIDFRLLVFTRNRTHHALNGKDKSYHFREILGIDLPNYKKWIEFQMKPHRNWSSIEINHMKPVSSFNVSYEEELLEAFNWKNTQQLLKEDNRKKQ